MTLSSQQRIVLLASMGYCPDVYIYLLVLYISGVIGQCENREPNCYSRFDYEYKILQRLIQLEESQNGLNEKLAASENEKDELKREIKRLEESQQDLTEKLMGNELEKGELKRAFAEKLAVNEQEKDELKDEINRISDLVNKLGDTGATEKVAFSAYIDATTSLSTKTIFNRVLINEHQAYDQSTGVFTCPISGVYMFSFVAAIRGDATTWAGLMVRGAATLHTIAEGIAGNQDLQGANIAVVKLSKGDEVWITGSGSLPGDSYGSSDKRTSSFSGFLIHPTTN